jgi:hypothetical protein
MKRAIIVYKMPLNCNCNFFIVSFTVIALSRPPPWPWGSGVTALVDLCLKI